MGLLNLYTDTTLTDRNRLIHSSTMTECRIEWGSAFQNLLVYYITLQFSTRGTMIGLPENSGCVWGWQAPLGNTITICFSGNKIV